MEEEKEWKLFRNSSDDISEDRKIFDKMLFSISHLYNSVYDLIT